MTERGDGWYGNGENEGKDRRIEDRGGGVHVLQEELEFRFLILMKLKDACPHLCKDIVMNLMPCHLRSICSLSPATGCTSAPMNKTQQHSSCPHVLFLNCELQCWLNYITAPPPKGGKQLNCNNMGDREDDVVYKMDLCVEIYFWRVILRMGLYTAFCRRVFSILKAKGCFLFFSHASFCLPT